MPGRDAMLVEQCSIERCFCSRLELAIEECWFAMASHGK